MQTKCKQIPNTFVPTWLEGLDNRTAIAREMRSRFDEVASDLGGVEHLSYAKRSLIARFLWLEYWLQQQEEALANGQDFDAGRWTQAANSLQGIVSKLGLERQSREVSLDAFVKARKK